MTSTTSQAQGLADEKTPFVRDCWYVGALCSEVGEGFLERWLLDEPLVMFRKQADGKATAISNRCPHRSFPLSLGKRVGDTIVCGYHGMTFDGTGVCVRVPSQEHAPASMRVQYYPTVERGSFVWVWMGDAEKADPALIPEAPYLFGSDFKSVTGFFDVGCSYVRLHENVLDLTHLPFLHGSVFTTPDFLVTADEVKQEGDKVYIRKTTAVGGVPPYLELMLGYKPEKAKRETRAWFLSPAVHYAEVDVTVSGRDKPVRLAYVHAFTPAGAKQTNYFWAVTRDAGIENMAVDESIAKSSAYVFNQDVEGLAAVEKLIERDARSFEEKSVKADMPGVLMRRILIAKAEAKR